ncbi:hypothetical protein FQR65_LT14727 [Abscondita terminalis]|nr:hypothetical protein FQR65_LT14727 [Abscondita terminalis]
MSADDQYTIIWATVLFSGIDLPPLRKNGTNPEVSEEGDVLYATLKQEGEEGIEKTTSVRTDIIEDAKIKKSLSGLKKDDSVKIDVKKAFKAADLARILGITEEEAEAIAPAKFELTVKNINRLEESE